MSKEPAILGVRIHSVYDLSSFVISVPHLRLTYRMSEIRDLTSIFDTLTYNVGCSLNSSTCLTPFINSWLSHRYSEHGFGYSSKLHLSLGLKDFRYVDISSLGSYLVIELCLSLMLSLCVPFTCYSLTCLILFMGRSL